VGIAVSWSRIKSLLSSIKRPAWLSALTCAGLALILGAIVAPRTTRILFDEQIYQQIGQTIAHTGKAYATAEGDAEYGELVVHGWEYNKQPMGYPYLLSLLYRVFGVHEFLCWLLNNAAFVLSTFLIFLIARLLSEDDWVAGYSALVFALIPMNAVWANTGAAEPTTVLTSLLAVFCSLIAFRLKTWSSLAMAAAALALATQFRMESILILVVVGLLALHSDWKALGWSKWVFVLCLFSLLVLPHLNHLWVVRTENWGADGGQKFLWSALRQNARENALFFVANAKWPVLFSILVGLGIASEKEWKCRSILVIWFLLMWGVFLPFYAGSYKYGADIRFSLLAYPSLALLAGLGVRRIVAFLAPRSSLRNAACGCAVVLIVAGAWFFPVTRMEGNEGWDARLDWRYAREFADKLPPGSAILTHDPSMFLMWGKNAAQMSMVSSNPDYFENHYFRRYGGNVYLHWDYWCNADMPRVVKEATHILEKYETELVAERQSRHAWYRLYRIKSDRVGRNASPIEKH
jgi:4-amino-4-deoxy-L-arabinose transferase-like glycosyltransferase